MIKKLYRKLFSERFRLQLHVRLRRMQAFWLTGDKVYCPCCGNSFSKFLSKGNGLVSRENAVCPSCGSLERTRLLYLYLKNETQIFEGNPKILHFAPEDVLKAKLIGNPNYVDADLNPNLARHEMDITDIKFNSNYFDFIICSHVLGHVPDEKKAVSELYRVLKPGGNLFFLSLLDPNAERTIEDHNKALSPQQKVKIYGEKDLQRLYGLDFGARISSLLVRVQRIDYRDRFSPNELQKMALGDGKREIIYKVVKI